MPRPHGLSQRVAKAANRFGHLIHAVALSEELTQFVGQFRMPFQNLTAIRCKTGLRRADEVGDDGFQLLVVFGVVVGCHRCAFGHENPFEVWLIASCVRFAFRQKDQGNANRKHTDRKPTRIKTTTLRIDPETFAVIHLGCSLKKVKNVG